MQLLPALEGWEASDSRGEIQRLGDADISRVRTNYSMEVDGETRRVTLEIVDGNNSPSLHTPFAMFAHAHEHSEVHKLQYEIDGHPAVAEWHPRTGKATAVMMVAQRFRVSLNGERITPQVIRQYFESLDTKQMAAWATPSPATPK